MSAPPPLTDNEAPPRTDLRSRNGDTGVLRVWMVVATFVAAGVAVPVWLNVREHGGAGAGYVAIVAFLWINVMISLWEIALYLTIARCEAQHRQFVAEYRGRELDRIIDFFRAPVRLHQVFRPSTWGEVWSTYSLFDEAYASRKSFGFWVDTGNGFVTLVPSVVFIYGLTFEMLSARVLGMMGLAIFWQMLYGTVVYFWAYLFNRQYVGHSRRNLALVVGGMNGLWFALPVWGLVVSVHLVASNAFDIIR
jgi:hypothetical protein